MVGAGTLGLCVIAALSRFREDVTRVIAVAKHPHQRELATRLGATSVAEPGELRRAVRRSTGSWVLASGQLSGGAPLVIDCVGSASSIADSLAVTAPGGALVLAGMPAPAHIDLTPLWQREVSLIGSYTYGPEPAMGGRHSFDLAFELAEAARLERLLSATYTLDRAAEAIEHAAAAGRRGSVKVAFDMRREKKRLSLKISNNASSRVRPRSRPLHTPRAHMARGGLQAGAPASRSEPRRLRAEPLAPLPDPDAAIRQALLEPIGDSAPLPELLFAGMRLTIAFDDLSLPLPPMRRPDNRQRVIEAVLEMAADAGVDDVVLIAALGLHRRMTDAELRHALGDRIFDAFAPTALSSNTTPRTLRNSSWSAKPKRARTSK